MARILKGLPQAIFLPSGICRYGLKRISSKERAKLGELQAELCKLELQASGDAGMVGGGGGVDGGGGRVGGDEISGDEMGSDDEMGGNDEGDADGNWSLGVTCSGGEVGYM